MKLVDKAGALIERIKRLPFMKQAVAVQERYGDDNAGLFADAITYQAFFSIFPMFLVASSVLGFILDDPSVQSRVIGEITDVIPGLGGTLASAISAIVASRRATGILGFIGLVWRGTSLVRTAGIALTAINHREKESNPAMRILWALRSAATLGLFGVSALIVASIGTSFPQGSIGRIALLLLSGALDLALFLLAYRVLTPGKGPNFRHLWPGAVVATVGWTLLKVIGASVAKRALTNATAVYGSLALSIGLLVVFSLMARIFMYGAITNVLHAEDAFQSLGSSDSKKRA